MNTETMQPKCLCLRLDSFTFKRAKRDKNGFKYLVKSPGRIDFDFNGQTRGKQNGKETRNLSQGS